MRKITRLILLLDVTLLRIGFVGCLVLIVTLCLWRYSAQPIQERKQSYRIAVLDSRSGPTHLRFVAELKTHLTNAFRGSNSVADVAIIADASMTYSTDLLSFLDQIHVRAVYLTDPSLLPTVLSSKNQFDIVITGTADPTRIGKIARLDDPNTRVTGYLAPSLHHAKTIELLLASCADIRSLAVVAPVDYFDSFAYQRIEESFASLRLHKMIIADDLGQLSGISQTTIDAYFVPTSTLMRKHHRQIIAKLESTGRPHAYSAIDWVRFGGQMGYQPAAQSYADKAARILSVLASGVPVHTIPIEVESRYDYAVQTTSAVDWSRCSARRMVGRANISLKQREVR
jgi:ABC-type uncharacterized transport system substrate-binding protein